MSIVYTEVIEDLTFISHRKILGGVKSTYSKAVLAKYNNLIPRNSAATNAVRADKLFRDAFFLKNLYSVSSLIILSESYIPWGNRSFLPFGFLNSFSLGPAMSTHYKLVLYRDLEQFSNFLQKDTLLRPISVVDKNNNYIVSLGNLPTTNSVKHFFSLPVNHSLFSHLSAN